MKINWGFKIAFLYCSFALMIIFMVYKSMQQPVDLVAENYYEKTLHYDNEIQKMNNAGLPENKIRILHENRQLSILFPEERKVTGEVKFFKPDNAMLDFAVNINENKVVYDTSRLQKGKWKLKISWIINNIAVYNEKNLIIN